jgi:hypothetical protein
MVSRSVQPTDRHYQGAAAHIRPYARVDGTKVWSLMQLERQLRPRPTGESASAASPAAASKPPTPATAQEFQWRRTARSAAPPAPFTKGEGLVRVFCVLTARSVAWGSEGTACRART